VAKRFLRLPTCSYRSIHSGLNLGFWTDILGGSRFGDKDGDKRFFSGRYMT